MKKFSYRIRDEFGIHARTVAMLAREAKKYESKIILHSERGTADLLNIMDVMKLNVCCNQVVVVEIEGADEEKTLKGMEEFFHNL